MDGLGLASFAVDGIYRLPDNPLVALCFLGHTEDNELVFSVRSDARISCTRMFPDGKIASMKEDPSGAEVMVRFKTFEYGQYTTLSAFTRRRLHGKRSCATRRGVLTCTT